MIQKNIFFIWFGDRPRYVDNCVQAFRQVNQDFNIRTYFFSDVHNTSNEDIEECIVACQRKNTFFNSWVNRLYYRDVCKCENAKWSDALRWHLLNKYGGIYLDCDTWPVKRFDWRLVSKQSFFVTRTTNKFFYRDSFFMGFERNFLTNKFINSTYINFNTTENKIWESENKYIDVLRMKMGENIFNYQIPEKLQSTNYEQSKKMFLDGTLKPNNGYLKRKEIQMSNSFPENYYIDHFFIKSWEAKV